MHSVHIAAVSTCAFTLHLAWELLQCEVFFVHGSYDSSMAAMVKASVGDVILTWILYVIVAVVSRRWRWAVGPWSGRQIATLLVASTALAADVEVRGLLAERWSYSDLMPIVPFLGVGVVPVVQLLVLTPAVVLLAERLSAPGRTIGGRDDSP